MIINIVSKIHDIGDTEEQQQIAINNNVKTLRATSNKSKGCMQKFDDDTTH